MFPNATVSSRSSSSRSGTNSCSRNSSMPSLRMPNPLLPKTSFNPLYRNSDAFTSFDATNFVFQESKRIKEKKQPVLRRYNSHDSHTNFSDVRIDSKGNTPNSTKSRTCDGSTPNTSPDSTEERTRRHEYEARDFLEKYSLPRVVRVENGEPLLLYRCFDSFTKVQARGILSKKGKEKADLNTLHFPEGYPGWFSLTNEKGEKAAVAHSSVLQLVREQVCSFISIQSFTAYTAGNQESSDGIMNSRAQYLKTQIRGGQVFQLRAVFQHRDRSEGGQHSTRSSRVSRSPRDKDLANRYAQLTSQNNQELYVPLTTKGEFYEIYSTMKARLCFAGLMDKTGPLALDKDCLYKLTHLLRRVALPIKVKLLSGSLPPGVPKEFTDAFILEKKFQEPLMVTCTLPPPENIKHEISCINLNSRVKLSKCALGFDSENRLFKSQRVQAALAFCHKNVENWYREVRLIPNLHLEILQQNPGEITCTECRKRNQACTEKCRKKQEDENTTKQLITKQVMDKFPKPKKWYRHFKILGVGLGSESNASGKYEDIKDPLDGMEKGKSMERYKDMSKLIEDKFGKKSYNPVKKSASFMYSNKRMDLEETSTDQKGNPALLKCQSLDAQIYTNEDDNRQLKLLKQKLHRKISNASETLSSMNFQMCILDNDNGVIDSKTSKTHGQSLRDLRSTNLQVAKVNFDEIKPVETAVKLKKTKPDLIPTLPKNEGSDSSYITDRLCSEFHVKTKIQKKSSSKQNLLSSTDNLRSSVRLIESLKERSFSIFDNGNQKNITTQSVIVQVHEESLPKTKSQKKISIVDDIPYSHVIDEVREREGKQDENIYAEICEKSCNCDSMPKCECKRTKKGNSEYCYVKLGSNGDSVIQSDSDEAIYNTLR